MQEEQPLFLCTCRRTFPPVVLGMEYVCFQKALFTNVNIFPARLEGVSTVNEEQSHEQWALPVLWLSKIYGRTVVQQSWNFFMRKSEIPANDEAQLFRCVYFSPPLRIHCWLLLLQAEIYTLVLPLVMSPKANPCGSVRSWMIFGKNSSVVLVSMFLCCSCL